MYITVPRLHSRPPLTQPSLFITTTSQFPPLPHRHSPTLTVTTTSHSHPLSHHCSPLLRPLARRQSSPPHHHLHFLVTRAGADLAISAGATETVRLEVRGIASSASHTSLVASAARGIVATAKHFDAVVAGLPAVNMSNVTAIVSRDHFAVNNFTTIGAIAVGAISHSESAHLSQPLSITR